MCFWPLAPAIALSPGERKTIENCVQLTCHPNFAMAGTTYVVLYINDDDHDRFFKLSLSLFCDLSSRKKGQIISDRELMTLTRFTQFFAPLMVAIFCDRHRIMIYDHVKHGWEFPDLGSPNICGRLILITGMSPSEKNYDHWSNIDQFDLP